MITRAVAAKRTQRERFARPDEPDEPDEPAAARARPPGCSVALTSSLESYSGAFPPAAFLRNWRPTEAPQSQGDSTSHPDLATAS